MAKRKIKRRRGEGISISGPATIHVSRRVLLIVNAQREARVERLTKEELTAHQSHGGATADGGV